jgi:hypothetical protein
MIKNKIMNLAESIKSLERLGYKIYTRPNNKYSVWWPRQKNQAEDWQQTATEVVKLARTMVKTNPGKKAVKHMTNKTIRRKFRQKLHDTDEDNDLIVNTSNKCDPWNYS